jgi:hypothetical protein
MNNGLICRTMLNVKIIAQSEGVNVRKGVDRRFERSSAYFRD